MTDVEFTGSRAKTAALLLASMGLAAGAALALRGPGPHDARLVLGLVLFGLGSGVLAVLLARPRRLRLDAEGFTVSGGLSRSPRRVAWREVEPFYVWRLPRGGRMIGYARRRESRSLAAYAQGAGSAAPDGVLPATWTQPLEQVVEQLNAHRTAALREGPALAARG